METFSKDWFMDLYNRLLDHFGDPHWWPGDTPFEISVGAILTQNTAWTNVEKAIEDLKGQDLLEPEALAQAPLETIAEAIISAGYFNQKAGYLKNLSFFIQDELKGDITSLSSLELSRSRSKLLSLIGIGKETADSILCYAVGAPTFVVDAYTKRIFGRLDPAGYQKMVQKGTSEYDQVQDHVVEQTKGDVQFYNRFHALLVYLGKDHCMTRPNCSTCPVKSSCETGKDISREVHRRKEK